MLLRLTLFVLIIAFSPFSLAVDYAFSGFLSLSAGLIDDEGYTLAGLDDEISFDNDTILGGQISGQFSDRFSATGQVVARGYSLDDSDNYHPSIEWLYFTYDVTPELRVRGGRMSTPYHNVSEYIEVGAVYPWVRPPFEVYDPNAAPVKNFNGFDVVLRSNWKDWFIISEFVLGQEENSTDHYIIDIDRIVGLNFHFTRNYFSFRIAYLVSEVSLDVFVIRDSIAPLRAIQNNNTIDTLVEIIESKNVDYIYKSIGFTWDNDTWFVYSEYNQPTSGLGFTPQGEGMYVTVGYHIGKFSPFITRADFRLLLGSKLKDFVNNELIGLEVIGDPILAAIEDNKRYQRSISLGVRYDLSGSISVKFEALRATPQNDSIGFFTPKESTVTSAPQINAFSIVLDVVF